MEVTNPARLLTALATLPTLQTLTAQPPAGVEGFGVEEASTGPAPPPQPRPTSTSPVSSANTSPVSLPASVRAALRSSPSLSPTEDYRMVASSPSPHTSPRYHVAAPRGVGVGTGARGGAGSRVGGQSHFDGATEEVAQLTELVQVLQYERDRERLARLSAEARLGTTTSDLLRHRKHAEELARHVVDLEGERREEQAEFGAVRMEIEALTVEHVAASEEVATLRQHLAAVTAERDELKTANDALAVKVTRLDALLTDRTKADELSADLLRTSTAKARMEVQVEMQAKVGGLETELDHARRSLASSQTAHKSEVELLKERLTDVRLAGLGNRLWFHSCQRNGCSHSDMVGGVFCCCFYFYPSGGKTK